MRNQKYEYTHRRSVRSICWNLCTDFINVNIFGAFSAILDKENSKLFRGACPRTPPHPPPPPLENARAEAARAFGTHSARMVKMSWFLISRCWQVCKEVSCRLTSVPRVFQNVWRTSSSVIPTYIRQGVNTRTQCPISAKQQDNVHSHLEGLNFGTGCRRVLTVWKVLTVLKSRLKLTSKDVSLIRPQLL